MRLYHLMEASRRFVSTSRAGPSESMRMDATCFFLAQYYFLSSHHSQVLAGFFCGVAIWKVHNLKYSNCALGT